LILLHPYDSPAQLLSDEVNTRPTRPEKTCARRRDRDPAHKHALRLRTGDLDYPRKKKKRIPRRRQQEPRGGRERGGGGGGGGGREEVMARTDSCLARVGAGAAIGGAVGGAVGKPPSSLKP